MRTPTRLCTDCKTPVSWQDKKCPYCGKKDPYFKLADKIGGAFLMILVLLTVTTCIGDPPSAKEKQNSAVFATCWAYIRELAASPQGNGQHYVPPVQLSNGNWKVAIDWYTPNGINSNTIHLTTCQISPDGRQLISVENKMMGFR